LGITFQQLLVQVADRAGAAFADRATWESGDGFDEARLGALGVDTIAFFDVPTS